MENSACLAPLLESLVSYGASAWYGDSTVQLNTKLARLVHAAMKVKGGNEHQPLRATSDQSVLRSEQRTEADASHVLHAEYRLLRLFTQSTTAN